MIAKILPHAAFVTARNETLASVRSAERGRLTALIGLSGCGKSEIRHSVMREVHGDTSIWSRGELPATMLLACPTEQGLFNSKEFARRLFHSVQDPDLSWLQDRSDIDDPDIVHRRGQISLDSEFWKKVRREQTEHGLRSQFIECARARSLKDLVIEQGGSLTHVGRTRRCDLHMQSIMCLTLDADTHTVLVGVPRMALLWANDPELNRRIHRIVVRRYTLDSDADVQEIKRIIVTLMPHMPSGDRQLLFRNLDAVYYGTLGSYDELRTFLRRCFAACTERQGRVLTLKDIDKAMYPASLLTAMYESASILDSIESSCARKDASKLYKSVISSAVTERS